jgi:hypothetical protein
MSDEVKKIQDNLKTVRNIKANIAISNIKKIKEKADEGKITYEDYKELKEYERDLKICLTEILIEEEKIK